MIRCFTTVLILASALVSAGCLKKDLRDTIDLIESSLNQAQLSETEVANGLKDAVLRGIEKGSRLAAAKNGYLENPDLKIGIPPEARKVEEALRQIGLGREVDRFVTQLNRAAEQAAGKAMPIFVNAISAMTISDAFGILNGVDDAATQYLAQATGDDLYNTFLPVVSDTLNQTRATRHYRDIVSRYNQLPGVKPVDPRLDAYATREAIQGLFLLMAREEANIRADPRARTTELLRRVFGSLD